MPLDKSRLFTLVNTYSLYGLALFPLVGFALSNICIVLFLFSSLFLGEKNGDQQEKKLILLSLVFPAILLLSTFWDTEMTLGLSKWSKILPLLVLLIIKAFKTGFIQQGVLRTAEKLFALGILIHLMILAALLIQFIFFTDQSAILDGKTIFFYSDIVQDLSTWKPRIATDYQKAYLSMCVVFALFVTVAHYFKSRKKFYLIGAAIFFVALIYFFSIPNVFAVFCLLPWWLYSRGLVKNKKALVATLGGMATLVLLFLGFSYQGDNLDITRDFTDMTKLLKGGEQESFKSDNPRGVIYSSLFRAVPAVPFFGYGMHDGSEKVKEVLYQSICDPDQEAGCKRNLLIESGNFFTYDWKSNGLAKSTSPDGLELTSVKNNCGAHTLFQEVGIKKAGIYTLSIRVKGVNDKFILRLGDISAQRIGFDFENADFLYVGSKVLSRKASLEGDGFYRLSLTTYLEEGKALALMAFSGSGKDYNHCSSLGKLWIKDPQLEYGEQASTYVLGPTEVEDAIIAERVNAHNSFLEYFFAAGYLGLIAYFLWYISLGKLTFRRAYWLGLPLVILILINATFEYILIRQWGLNSVFLFLLLILFGDDESADQ